MPQVECTVCGEESMHAVEVAVACDRYSSHVHKASCITCLLMEIDDCCYDIRTIRSEIMVAVEGLLIQKAYIDCKDAHAEIDNEIRELLERGCGSPVATAQSSPAIYVDLTSEDEMEVDDHVLEDGNSFDHPIDLTLDSDEEMDVDEEVEFAATRWDYPAYLRNIKEQSPCLSPRSLTLGRSESRTLSLSPDRRIEYKH